MPKDLNRRNKFIASFVIVSVATLLVAGACVGLKSSSGSSSTNSKSVVPLPRLSNNTAQASGPADIDQGGIGDNASNETSAQTSSSSHHHHHRS